jgi:hypothetical protein
MKAVVRVSRGRFGFRGGFSLVEVLASMLVFAFLFASFSIVAPTLLDSMDPVPLRSKVFPEYSLDEASATGWSGHGDFGLDATSGAVLHDGEDADGWNWFERAPSVSASYRSISYFSSFLRLLEWADWSVVLGGEDYVPEVLRTFTSGRSVELLPAPFSMSEDSDSIRRGLRGTGVGARLGIVGDGSDTGDFGQPLFQVLSFRGADELIGVAEVYRWSEVLGGASRVMYAANLWYLSGGTWYLRDYYRFWVPPEADALWEEPVGAMHLWRRVDPAWGVVDEGPCRVVFPDPGINPAALPGGGRMSSRRVYFIE